MWCFGRRASERYRPDGDGDGACGTSGRGEGDHEAGSGGRRARRQRQRPGRPPPKSNGHAAAPPDARGGGAPAGDGPGAGDPAESEMRKDRLANIMASNLCEIDPALKRRIGEKRLSILRRQFSWHDSDNNGYIESHELPDFLRAAGFNPVQPSLELWCSHLDSQNLGCLTFPDYVKFWWQNNSELEHDEALIQMAFKFFDRDGDGNVDKVELGECLQELGDPLTQAEIDQFFHHVRRAAAARARHSPPDRSI